MSGSRLTRDGVSRAIPQRVAERAVSAVAAGRVANLDLGACWLSTYSRGSHGYAQVGWHEDGKVYMTTAHRAAWVAEYGQIGGNLTVDHLCRVRPCVRPSHLRLLTNSDNAADNGMDRLRTRIPSGRMCRAGLHEMVVDSNGRVSCRECANQRRRERRHLAA